MTTSSTTGSAVPAAHQNVIPSEVGWQFVPQYYTFVNKQPNRLHCFYTKSSTFIHGTEGEDGTPCFGQQEIHNKILSIGFQDCKVFIHSVDAQASAAGGIIIQVIGEMSNRGEPWKKFVQTFFLAEQPNGYFVLNDIFRFLKEESVEDEEATSETGEAQTAPIIQEPVQPSATQEQHIPEPVHHEHVPITVAPVNIPTPAPAPVIEHREPSPTPAPEPEPVPVTEPVKQPNGVHHSPEPETVAEPVDETPAPKEEASAPEPIPEPQPAPPSPAPAPVTAASSPPPTSVPSQAPAQQPKPQQHKTWANLAASNPSKWGSAVAQDRTGTSVEAAVASPPVSGTQTPVHAPRATTPNRQHSQQGQQHGQGKNHPAYIAAMQLNSPQVFVKGFVDPITKEALKAELSKFGTITELDAHKERACAFVEYSTVDAARRAIIASLNHNQGGEGGVKVDCGPEHGKIRISVEVRKERGDRPPPRQHAHSNSRGGQPNQSGGGGNNERGGFRGRGRGRGPPPAVGAKA